MKDETAVKAYSDKAKTNPYAFVVYQPQGKDGTDMGRNLIIQFISDTLSAMVVAFVLGLGAFGFSKRVFIATALGLFSWLTLSVPYWNWYRFPTDFTLGAMLEQVIGWLLAGVALALQFLGPRLQLLALALQRFEGANIELEATGGRQACGSFGQLAAQERGIEHRGIPEMKRDAELSPRPAHSRNECLQSAAAPPQEPGHGHASQQPADHLLKHGAEREIGRKPIPVPIRDAEGQP